MKRYEQGSVGMRPDPEGSWCDYAEARAEIERLRKEVTKYKARNAEIERLRQLVYAVPPTENMTGQTWKEAAYANREEAARLDKMLRTHRLPDEVVDIKVVIELRAEIERLRGLLGDVQIIMDSHNNIVGNLNGEITRLRGLLREGLDHHDEYNWQQRIREALGE